MPARTPRRSAGRRAIVPGTPRTTPGGGGSGGGVSGMPTPGTPSSGRGTDGLFVDGHWMCDCRPRLKAVLRETQKPGRNKGRWFYTCPRDRRQQCKFFMWEDYAGIARGGGGAAGGAAGGAPARPVTAPRPTYRTSIGQRTTPPAERFGDPLQQMARSAGMLQQQQALPPPPPVMTQSVGRQRTFRTALNDVQPVDTKMRDVDSSSSSSSDDDDDDEDDGFDAPPTPTPVRTRRVGVGPGTSSPSVNTRSTRSRSAAAAAAASGAAGRAAATSTPGKQITDYFAMAKKDRPGIRTEPKVSPPVPAAPSPPPPPADKRGALFSDDSDSETERGMLAITISAEPSFNGKDAADANAVKKEESASGGDNDVDMDGDGGGDGDDAGNKHARGFIVPVLTPTRTRSTRNSNKNNSSSITSRTGTRHLRHRLLVASEESAAKEAAASGGGEKADKKEAEKGAGMGTEEGAENAATKENAPAPEVSFAALFGSGRERQKQQERQELREQQEHQEHQEHQQQAPPAPLQPLPNFSFSSSGMVSSQASTVASSSQPPGLTQSLATPDTSLSSSLRSNTGLPPVADETETATGKRKRAGHDKESHWYDHGTQEASSDEDDDEDGEAGGRVSKEDLDLFMTPSKRVCFRKDSAPTETAPTEAVPTGAARQKDHNVTRAVLQLLEGQNVEARVLQQVRALLNISFDAEGL